MFQAIHLPSVEVVFHAQFLGAALLLASMIFGERLHTRLPQREKLNARFERSRLRKMLTLRQVDTGVYLGTVSTAGLDLHLEKCHDCSQKKQCETALRDGGAASFAFCPNDGMIERQSQVQKSQQ